MFPVDRTEIVALDAALGRVLAEDAVARETLPSFARATMDGYAVRAADTHGASEQSPAYLRLVGDVPTGVVPAVRVDAREAVRTHTGAMLPPGADAVVMVEDTNLHPSAGSAEAEVEVLDAAAPGENVLAVGEDVRAGAVAIPAGRRLRAADVGGLAALGIVRVAVRARPRIAILSTGDEVVPAGAAPGPAQVRDVNGTTVAAVVAQAGGIAVPRGIVPDDAAALEQALRDALGDADAVVLSAGSSVSVRDLTAQVVARLGAPGVLVHGIAIKPGKPTVLAICDGTPVVGLPGNPASALVVAWRIVRPLVRLLARRTRRPGWCGRRARDERGARRAGAVAAGARGLRAVHARARRCGRAARDAGVRRVELDLHADPRRRADRRAARPQRARRRRDRARDRAVSERTVFLHDVPLERARERFDDALRAAGVFDELGGHRSAATETLALDDALDRVTAAPVIARLSSPHYHACAMDGIAVVAARTAGALETAPVELALGTEAVVVDTGDPLPAGFDAVIPIEQVEPRGGERVAVRAAAAPFQHVRAIGEDVVASEVVVPALRRLGVADLAACATAGVAAVEVVRRPRVAVITTGDELVDVTADAPVPGAILDSNGVLLRACVRSYGGEVGARAARAR